MLRGLLFQSRNRTELGARMTLVQESSTSATISSRSSSSPMRSDSWQECSAERRILQTMTTLPKIRTSGCCQGSEWIYGRRKITPSCLCTRQISRTCREFSRKTQWLKPSRVLRSLSSCGEDQRDLPWRFTDVVWFFLWVVSIPLPLHDAHESLVQNSISDSSLDTDVYALALLPFPRHDSWAFMDRLGLEVLVDSAQYLAGSIHAPDHEAGE